MAQLSVFTIDRAKWVIQWRFALFEAIRDPYISVGHKVKQVWLPNDRVSILDIHCHALMQGSLIASNSANRH